MTAIGAAGRLVSEEEPSLQLSVIGLGTKERLMSPLPIGFDSQPLASNERFD